MEAGATKAMDLGTCGASRLEMVVNIGFATVKARATTLIGMPTVIFSNVMGKNPHALDDRCCRVSQARRGCLQLLPPRLDNFGQTT